MVVLKPRILYKPLKDTTSIPAPVSMGVPPPGTNPPPSPPLSKEFPSRSLEISIFETQLDKMLILRNICNWLSILCHKYFGFFAKL